MVRNLSRIFVMLVLVLASISQAATWDISADFHTATNTDADIWQYRYGARDFAVLLPVYDDPYNQGGQSWIPGPDLAAWARANDSSTFVTHNDSGVHQTLYGNNVNVPANGVIMDATVVVVWKSPITGLIEISFEVIRQQNNTSGDGIDYFVDLNNSTGNIATLSGHLSQIGGLGATTGTLTASVSVTVGDKILFRLDPGTAGSPDSDISQIKATITSTSVSPPNGSEYLKEDIGLYWNDSAVSYNVYFGTDFNDVNDATPQSSEYQDNQTATTFDPDISGLGTYYWRIDEVNGGITKGDVWSFTVGGPKASEPSPQDSTIIDANGIELSWLSGVGSESSNVYIGTDFNDVNDAVAGVALTSDFDYSGLIDLNDLAVLLGQWLTNPNGLIPSADMDDNNSVDMVDYSSVAGQWNLSGVYRGNTTDANFTVNAVLKPDVYYWRIDEVNDIGGITKGDVWDFTAIGPGAIRIVSIPDLINYDIGDISGAPGWDGGANSTSVWWENVLNYVVDEVAAESPDFVMVAGDLVVGHWDYDLSGRAIFGPMGNLTQKRAALYNAADCYYSQWNERFDSRGLTVHACVGDHEIGDNDWGVNTDKSRLVPDYKAAFAKHFTKTTGGSPRYANRPVGTDYEYTAYAFQHGNALFITVDVFKFEDASVQLDPGTGTVRGEVDGGQLAWLENTLITANSDPNIDHIIVQGHMPYLTPVRYQSSSNLSCPGGETTDFWNLLMQYDVDLYLCGEVHDMTASNYGGVEQVTHGGVYGAGSTSDTSYMVMTIDGDIINLELKRIDLVYNGNTSRMWALGGNRPLVEHYVDTANGYQTVGTLTIDKSSGSTVYKNRTGYFTWYGTMP